MKNYKYLYNKYKTKYFLLNGGSPYFDYIKNLDTINILLGASSENPNDLLRFQNHLLFNVYIDECSSILNFNKCMVSMKPHSFKQIILKYKKSEAKINIFFDKFVIDFIRWSIFNRTYLENNDIHFIMFELRKNKHPRASFIKSIKEDGSINIRRVNMDFVDRIDDDYYYIENNIIKWRRTPNLEEIIKKDVIAPPNIGVSEFVDGKFIYLESDDRQYFEIYATIITEPSGPFKDFIFEIKEYTYKNYTYPFEIRLKLVKSIDTEEPEIDPNEKFIEIYEDSDLIFNQIMTREERYRYIHERIITDEFMIILEERLSENPIISIDKMRYLFNKPHYYIEFRRK